MTCPQEPRVAEVRHYPTQAAGACRDTAQRTISVPALVPHKDWHSEVLSFLRCSS